MGATQATKTDGKSAEIDAKQIAADLMKGFDLDKNFMLDKTEIERFRDYCIKEGVSRKLADGLAAAAKKASVSKTPKAIDDLLEYAKLTQYKEALIKAGAKDLGVMLKLTSEELTALAKKAGLKLGHLARLRRAVDETKESIDNGASTIGEHIEGMVPMEAIEAWAKTISLSVGDAKKLKKLCLESAQDASAPTVDPIVALGTSDGPSIGAAPPMSGWALEDASARPTLLMGKGRQAPVSIKMSNWVETKGGLRNQTTGEMVPYWTAEGKIRTAQIRAKMGSAYN